MESCSVTDHVSVYVYIHLKVPTSEKFSSNLTKPSEELAEEPAGFISWSIISSENFYWYRILHNIWLQSSV